jgi:hypothetical protein
MKPIDYPHIVKTSAKGTSFLSLTNSEEEVLIDACYYDWLSRYRWQLTKGETKVYVRATAQPCYRLHRLLLRAPQGLQVDHINRNTLDNRLENLRLATRPQNQANAGLRRDNTSGYRGVSWAKDCDKWRAQVRVIGHKKSMHLGMFASQEDAARAHDWGIIVLQGAQFVQPQLPLEPIDPLVLKRLIRVLDGSRRPL